MSVSCERQTDSQLLSADCGKGGDAAFSYSHKAGRQIDCTAGPGVAWDQDARRQLRIFSALAAQDDELRR